MQKQPEHISCPVEQERGTGKDARELGIVPHHTRFVNKHISMRARNRTVLISEPYYNLKLPTHFRAEPYECIPTTSLVTRLMLH